MSEGTGVGKANTPSFRSQESGAIDLRAVLLAMLLAPVVYGFILFAFAHQNIRVPVATVNELQAPSVAESHKIRPIMIFSSQHTRMRTIVAVKIRMTTQGDAPLPTGTVNILDGWTLVGKATLVHGAATLQITRSSQNNLPLNAIYTGDNNYLSANSFHVSH